MKDITLLRILAWALIVAALAHTWWAFKTSAEDDCGCDEPPLVPPARLETL